MAKLSQEEIVFNLPFLPLPTICPLDTLVRTSYYAFSPLARMSSRDQLASQLIALPFLLLKQL